MIGVDDGRDPKTGRSRFLYQELGPGSRQRGLATTLPQQKKISKQIGAGAASAVPAGAVDGAIS